MTVNGITAQKGSVFPGGGEGSFHNPALASVERSFEFAAHVLVPDSTCERDSSYGPTTVPSSVIQVTCGCEHNVPLKAAAPDMGSGSASGRKSKDERVEVKRISNCRNQVRRQRRRPDDSREAPI